MTKHICDICLAETANDTRCSITLSKVRGPDMIEWPFDACVKCQLHIQDFILKLLKLKK